jgi:hypothetical protein
MLGHRGDDDAGATTGDGVPEFFEHKSSAVQINGKDRRRLVKARRRRRE